MQSLISFSLSLFLLHTLSIYTSVLPFLSWFDVLCTGHDWKNKTPESNLIASSLASSSSSPSSSSTPLSLSFRHPLLVRYISASPLGRLPWSPYLLSLSYWSWQSGQVWWTPPPTSCSGPARGSVMQGPWWTSTSPWSMPVLRCRRRQRWQGLEEGCFTPASAGYTAPWGRA